MFWFVLILLFLAIIASTVFPSYIAPVDEHGLPLDKESLEETIEKLNSAIKAKFVFGIISIIVSIIPIIDAFLPKDDYFLSPILKISYWRYVSIFGIVIIWGFVIGWIIWMFLHIKYKKKNRTKLEDEINLIKEEIEEAKRLRDKKKQQLSKLTSQYGKPAKIVYLSDDYLDEEDINNAFIVFPSSCCIKYKRRVFSYSELVSSEVKDESYTTTSGMKYEVTKSSSGSTIGRAVVGGLIAGPAGAIIGGVTSKKKTEVIDNTMSHYNEHYFVIITLTTLKESVIKIDCDDSLEKAEEINAILVGIIANQAKVDSKSISIADELKKMAILREKGILTEEEFLEQKSNILGGTARCGERK